MAMQNSIWQKMGRMREKHPVSYVRRLKKPIALACISVTVTFTEKAGLPEGTKLQVKEITGAAGSRYPESICSESYIFS